MLFEQEVQSVRFDTKLIGAVVENLLVITHLRQIGTRHCL